MYIPTFCFILRLISILLLLSKVPNSIAFGINPPPKRPNLYRWLAQNSYICDPTLLNKRSHRFLSPRESVKLRCSCGDPLVTKTACGRRNGSRDKPKCFRLPDACIQEYTVIFSNGGNRLSKPLVHVAPHPKLLRRTTIKPRRRRPITVKTVVKKRPHRMPKIVSTIPVTTVLRVRKLKRPH